MDGNGRWALARGLPRVAGHSTGAQAVSRVAEAAPELGIAVLTLFAFSSDNWRRPRPEVDGLMHLLDLYLDRETPKAVERGVRLEVIGRRDRLDPALQTRIAAAEQATRNAWL
jgi:undecaprenyl diphosphate synthase